MTMNRVVLAAASISIAFAGLIGSFGIASADDSPSLNDRGMSRSDFPCEEDEVLGYAPQFGPDRVGCIHIEQFEDSVGSMTEDEPGWSCVDDGNRICGPGNDQGAPAGQYDQGGVLVTPWAQLVSDDEPDSFN